MVVPPRVSGLRLESTNVYPALPLACRSWPVSVRLPGFDRRPDLSLLDCNVYLGEFRRRPITAALRVHHRRSHRHPQRHHRCACADIRFSACCAWFSQVPASVVLNIGAPAAFTVAVLTSGNAMAAPNITSRRSHLTCCFLFWFYVSIANGEDCLGPMVRMHRGGKSLTL
jgi:hypothetical protein